MSGQWQAKIGEREFDSEVYDADGDMLACELTETQARVIAAAPELLAALRNLQQQIHSAVKMDVRKHFSLMVADAAAGKAIRKAEFGGLDKTGEYHAVTPETEQE